MNYEEVITYLYSQLQSFQKIGKGAYKPGLDNAESLDQYFNFPHKKYKTIHVAGTNGKGSVSHLLASVLQEAGYRTGLFTSPHLKDFRERIKVNGLMITEDEVVQWFEKHQPFIVKIKPSFFEMTSALAFDYFAEREVDIAVIETGLGGRLDSTNIVNPIISVITNIGMDHTDLLGDSLDKIAIEKAGIIKKNVPVVIGESHPKTKDIFINIADENMAEIIFADKQFTIKKAFITANNFQMFEVEKNNRAVYPGLRSQLLGVYQAKNVPTVLSVIELIRDQNIEIEDTHVFRGFKNVVTSTGLLGRWQVLSERPYVVCDTGHNVDGIKEIVLQIERITVEKLYIVLGMVKDKDIDGILNLLPKKAVYCFTKANIPRAMNEVELQERAKVFGLRGSCFATVKEAYQHALLCANEKDMVFVGGSTFVVAEVL